MSDMKEFHGRGVYDAAAVGRVFLLKHKKTQVRRTHVDDIKREIKRFEQTKALSISQLDEIYKRTIEEVGSEDAGIFEIHMMLLDDEDYNEYISNVLSKGFNAEYAVALASDYFCELFAAMDDDYMSERSADIKDVSERVIANLKGAAQGEGLSEPSIVCADDLSPSETAELDREMVLAFVTAHGSVNSHTAILARSMNVPAVVGVGDAFLASLSNGSICAVDGGSGDVIVNPDEKTLEKFNQRLSDDKQELIRLDELRGKENITLDGRSIEICVNVNGESEIGVAAECDASGVGLFRSEFLYLEGESYPSEDRQFDAYKRVLESMNGKRVVIRTLDIGADKSADYFELKKEENPALGLRAIRICLTRPEIFKTQLRALYRASIYGRLAIMFPMISSVSEVEQALALCSEVKQELDECGIAYSKDVEIGIMIETPAAAVISDRLATMVDFFSVGTNDLTQYTLACDRQNPQLEQFCDTHHEAIIRLIEYSCQNIHDNGGWIGICGELATDLSLTEAFLKMGIDELSVSPPFVLRLRKRVRSLNLSR